MAVDLTWNPGGAGGGSGTWETTTASWDNAGTPQAWNNAADDTAIFAGAAGTVTLGEAITAAGLQFDTAGYTIAKGGNNLTATNLVGSVAATISGVGTLSITGSSSGYSGDVTLGEGVTATPTTDLIVVGAADSLGTGTLNMRGGQLQAGTSGLAIANAVTVGDGGLRLGGTNDFTLSGTVTLDNVTRSIVNYGTATVSINAIDLTAGTGSIANFNGGAVTVSGGISGSGGISVTGATAATLAGATTFTGATAVSAGTLTLANQLAAQDSGLAYTGGSLVFDSSVAGNAFTFGSLAGSATLSLQNNAPTPAAVAVTAGGNDASTTYSGTISGAGSLTKTGTGTLTLSGANSLSGATSVSGGSLVVTNTMRNTSGMTVSNGATLELGTTNMFVAGHGVAVADSRVLTANAGTLLMNGSMDSRIGNVTLTNGGTWTSNRGTSGFDILLGNTTAGPATVTVSGTGASTMNGTGGIHLQGVQNFAVADVTGDTSTDLTVSMILANPGSSGGDAGGINKTGAGTMLLAAANSYAGSTIVAEGTLIVGNGANAGSIGSGAVSVASGATLTIDRGGFGQVWANNFSGAGTLRIEAGQDPQFSGDNSSFTGPVIIDGLDAQFRTRSANAWSGQSVVTITNGGMASVFSYVNSNDIKAGSLWGDGTVRLGAGGADRDLYVGGNNLDATFTGTIINDAGGSGSVIKLGTGTQTLSGNNSYSGGTIVSAGTLVATANNALSSSGTVTLGDASSAANDAAVLIDATAATVTIARAVTVANQGTGTFTLGSTTTGGGGFATFSGGVTLARDVTLDGGVAGDRLQFSGGISGTGNVTIAGSNRVVFISAANTYAGSTTIDGTLQLSDGSGTSTSLLPDDQTVSVSAGGALNLAKGNNSETIGPLTGSGTVQNIVGGITSTLILGGGDGSGTFSGLLSNPAGTLVIEKTGSGTQVFSAANTYSGSTTINAGTLVAGNANAFGTTGAISLGASGTLGVADGVTFSRPFSLVSGSRVRTGNTSTVALPSVAALAAWESQSANGDLTLAEILDASGSTTPTALFSAWTANPDPATYLSDILTLEGTGSGNTYVLSMEYASTFGDMNIWYRPTVNDPFTPLGTSFQGNVAWNSGFTTVGQYGVDPATSTVWAVTDHNSQFVIVPEPAGIAILAGAAATALAFRRRRLAATL